MYCVGVGGVKDGYIPDHAAEVSLGLDILTDAEVARSLFEERVL